VAWRRGILLLGPPGNGKTHAVKALVNAVDRPCLYVRSFRSAHTADESNMETVFVRARSAAPCILVFEDLDALITEENRAFFLNELDGFESNAGILTLATTNHPERLDPAIIDRPSRFDRKYTFDLPGRTERAAYIDAWNARLEPELRLSSDGVQQIADATDGFSFAYLKELLVAASIRWMVTQQTGTMDAIALEQALALGRDVTRGAAPEAPVDRGDRAAGVAYGRIFGEANDGYDRGGRRAIRRRVP
jgi:AAA+ superfamily predicted ATPase